MFEDKPNFAPRKTDGIWLYCVKILNSSLAYDIPMKLNKSLKLNK